MNLISEMSRISVNYIILRTFNEKSGVSSMILGSYKNSLGSDPNGLTDHLLVILLSAISEKNSLSLP